ncbi:MAG: TIGR02996 domain-containing protein [Gemmataceae bacterium]
MTTQQQLYQAILDNPDDDAPRLIFADWLEENGDTERATFIRKQIEVANWSVDHPKRMTMGDPGWDFEKSIAGGGYELAEQRSPVWDPELQDVGRTRRYRRGFVEDVEFSTCQSFLRAAKRMFENAPVQTVAIRRSFTGSKAWNRCPYLDRLRRLALLGWDEIRWKATVFADVLKSESLSNLRALDLMNLPVLADAIPKVLADAGHLDKLSLLWLDESIIGDAGLKQLAIIPHLASVRVLGLRGCDLSWNGIEHLAQSQYLQNIEELYLGVGNRWYDENSLGTRGIRALVEASFPNLRVLNLESCEIGDAGLLVLAKWPGLASVRYLDLSWNNYSEKGLIAFTESSYLQGLRRLKIGSEFYMDAVAQAILRSPHLSQLLELNVDSENLSESMLNALQERFGDRLGEPDDGY